MAQRLSKILSAHGVASRREAERMISAGRVTVNGATAQIGQSAEPETDQILVDGKPLRAPDRRVYIMLNKPRGYLTTVADDRGRKTVMSLVSDLNMRVYPVGRLDYDSEGLLLLTNDGDFANIVMHPSHEKEKVYAVTVRGDTVRAPACLSAPMKIDGYEIAPARVRVVSQSGDEALLEIAIREGRNRQIRKMCAACGLTVKTLRRLQIGTVSLGTLPVGRWRHLTEEEVRSFLQ